MTKMMIDDRCRDERYFVHRNITLEQRLTENSKAAGKE